MLNWIKYKRPIWLLFLQFSCVRPTNFTMSFRSLIIATALLQVKGEESLESCPQLPDLGIYYFEQTFNARAFHFQNIPPEPSCMTLSIRGFGVDFHSSLNRSTILYTVPSRLSTQNESSAVYVNNNWVLHYHCLSGIGTSLKIQLIIGSSFQNASREETLERIHYFSKYYNSSGLNVDFRIWDDDQCSYGEEFATTNLRRQTEIVGLPLGFIISVAVVFGITWIYIACVRDRQRNYTLT